MYVWNDCTSVLFFLTHPDLDTGCGNICPIIKVIFNRTPGVVFDNHCVTAMQGMNCSRKVINYIHTRFTTHFRLLRLDATALRADVCHVTSFVYSAMLTRKAAAKMNDTGVNFKTSICFGDMRKDRDPILLQRLCLGKFHIHKKHLQEQIQNDTRKDKRIRRG